MASKIRVPSANLIEFKGRQITLPKMEQCMQIVHETIDALDDVALKQLCSGYGGDIDKVFDELVGEAYDILYGGKGQPELPETSSMYLDKLSSSFEEQLRINNMNYFVATMMPEVEMNWHHIEWGELINKYSRIGLLASRDHGKSFWFTNMYPIWKMYRYNATSQNKQLRAREGFIFAHTKDKAAHNVEIVQDTILANDQLKELLYSPKGFLKQELKAKNGAIIRTKGLMGNTRGFHPQWIVCDDILTDNMLYSKAQREKAIEYFFSVVENMCVPEGQIICVGTPFHKQDLYGVFKQPEKQRIWAYREYPAIFPDGRVLWSNRYSYRDLLKKRDGQGSLRFSREFLCRPVATDSSIFPWDILENATKGMQNYTLVPNIEAFPIKFKQVVAACDFAKSANVGADFTVYTVWGIDQDENMWLLYVYRKLGASFNEQVSQINHIYNSFKPAVIVLENNNFQSLYEEHFKNTNLPIKPHTTGTGKGDWNKGVPSMAIMFERSKIRFPKGDKHSIEIADHFMSEFNSVTFTDKGIQGVGQHDDCVMSTWLGTIAATFAKEGSFGFDFL